jgi:hypothetical protein
MLENLLDQLSKFDSIVFIFLVPGALLGTFFWKRLAVAHRWLVLFLWFDLCIELGARWWVWLHISTKNNLPLLHLYTLGELIIWMLFFQTLAKTAEAKRRMVWILLGLALLVIANSIWIQPLHTFCSYSKTLVQLTLVVLCLRHEFSFLENDDFLEKKEKPFKWVNRAALLYYGGSMFVFMFSEYAPAAWHQGYHWLWDFNIILNVFLHLNILIAIWKTATIYPKSSI